MNNKEWKGFGKEPKKTFQRVSDETMKEWVKQANKGNVNAQMNIANWWNNLCEEDANKEGSLMIKESDYEPMDCCLCGSHMPSIHSTHNPYPFTDNTTAKMALDDHLPHRCCSNCAREKVIPARMSSNFDQFTKDRFYEDHYSGKS